ncbi:hypothetical protein BDV33DRAFT_204629 [Aspergillus novoparasiticus]|uniref:BTB domain-containing protein n=1 Tax=Aspergillus novoparasiticus TaxID=986946 RepID=A0A5N6ENX5_9EURO|nr:hypothetical protein BDV33DRAFT_204629 [Aspergillus novoparasiticus]
MDNNTTQNGHQWGSTPTANPLGTSFGFGSYFRDHVSSSRNDLGTEKYWERPLAVQEPEPPAEPRPEPKLPDDPLYNNWDNLSSKDKKKREKLLVKKGFPIPGKDFEWPPPHPPSPPPPPPPPPASPPAEPEPKPEPESIFGFATPEVEPQSEPKAESPTPTSFPPQPDRSLGVQNGVKGSSVLLSLLSKIRDTGAFSDLKINCRGLTYNTHSCIVCPQSSFFEKAINDGLKEITIVDYPLVVNKMLDYLYREDYDEHELAIEAQKYQGQGPALPKYANAMMLVTADEYAIRGLKDLAETKLVTNLKCEWNDTDFIQLIEYVHGSHTPPNATLQSIVAQFAARHVSTLKKFETFHGILKEFPDFTYGFSREMMGRVVQLEKEVL